MFAALTEPTPYTVPYLSIILHYILYSLHAYLRLKITLPRHCICLGARSIGVSASRQQVNDECCTICMHRHIERALLFTATPTVDTYWHKACTGRLCVLSRCVPLLVCKTPMTSPPPSSLLSCDSNKVATVLDYRKPAKTRLQSANRRVFRAKQKHPPAFPHGFSYS